MKKVTFTFGLFMIICFTAFNLSYAEKSSLSLDRKCTIMNIKALQVSAGEAYCDPVLVQYCEIVIGGFTLKGIGVERKE